MSRNAADRAKERIVTLFHAMEEDLQRASCGTGGLKRAVSPHGGVHYWTRASRNEDHDGANAQRHNNRRCTAFHDSDPVFLPQVRSAAAAMSGVTPAGLGRST